MYRDKLIPIGLLPLATWLELQDILFLVKHIKQPSDNFNIRFRDSVTRSSAKRHLMHNYIQENHHSKALL